MQSTESASLSQVRENMYHLHAIMVHSGSLNSGHYYCFIRPRLGDQWYKCNDNCVTKVGKELMFAVGRGGYQSRFEIGQNGENNIGSVFEKATPMNA